MMQHQQTQSAADGPDLVGPRHILGYGGNQRHQVVADGVVQVVLVPEVGVKRHRSDAELGREPAQAERVRAFGLHQIQRGPHDQLGAQRVPRCAGHVMHLPSTFITYSV